MLCMKKIEFKIVEASGRVYYDPAVQGFSENLKVYSFKNTFCVLLV